MANVWKIGSRWSESGAKNKSIISIFRRNNVVFIGTETEKFKNQVRKGDYFAIADGFDIPAIAKAISDPMPLSEMQISVSDDEAKIFDYNECCDWSYGVKIKLIDLDPSQYIPYNKRGAFFAANQIWQKVVDLYNNYDRQFNISSHTYTLCGNSDQHKRLLDRTRFVIPVYQRPYSWSESQIEPFIDDIFKGFWGAEKDMSMQEPLFIGTMQLSEKKFISKTEYEQEVIDGQQRISTITVLLKVLQLKYPDCQALTNLKFDWLETKVNNGTQNEILNQLLKVITSFDELLNHTGDQNRYIYNAKLISNYIDENIKNEQESERVFEINKFVEYLFSALYIVVIETCAGISKTIQIFNTINTTGLDLNGGDLFKVRMYEYLRDKKDQDESAFDRISDLYKSIDDKNKLCNKNVTDIIDILSIYKHYIIAEYNLPDVLFDYGTETFFDRLFDKILGVKDWEHFGKAVEIDLSLEDIDRCIEVRFMWHSSKYISVENMFALRMLWWSRYSKYWRVVYLLLFKYKDDSNISEKMSIILILINKIAFIYSIRHSKSVYRAQSYMQSVIKRAVNSDFDELVAYLEDKLNNHCNQEHTKHMLSGYIADNVKQKNLICRMSAYFDEIEGVDMFDSAKIEELEKKLFKPEKRIDIEHIHANADDSKEIDNTLQNGIGNLSILEYDINIGISNKPFAKKQERYKDSIYKSIHSLLQYEQWGEDEIIARRERVVASIINYLFNHNQHVVL